MPMSEHPTRTVLVATPSLEAYGSDLQMLQSVAGLVAAGWRVVVAANAPGRLSSRLTDLGAELVELDFPVLRRASASGSGLVSLAASAARSLPRMVAAIRRIRPTALYVNTVTLPWWLLAGRIARVPTLCHVHEAESRDSRNVRRGLTLPLLLAPVVIVNSFATETTIVDVVPRLRPRLRRVPNGVEGPSIEPTATSAGRDPARLVVVGRLSPRKAPDVALEATAILRAAGHDVALDLCGTPVEGMEWFVTQLEERAERPDLNGAVNFAGYTSPIWPALERADVVLAPSLGESFGNAVVEGQLAQRPVVATALQGHLETITDGETGLLVPSEDPESMAAAVTRVLEDPDLAERLARQGRESAVANFSLQRYQTEVCDVLDQLVER